MNTPLKILTTKDIKNLPVTWGGGNPRTGQRAQFVFYNNVAKTRTVLDTHEREQNARDEATYAPDGSTDRLNPQAQMGRRIPVTDMILRLKRMNPNLIIEIHQNDPSRYCVSIEKDGHNIKTGQHGRYKQFLCAFGSTEDLPEFSVMAPRMEDRPTPDGRIENRIKHAYEKTRGWRTVLAKLCAAGLICEAQIEKEFHVGAGRSSELWQKQIQSPIHI